MNPQAKLIMSQLRHQHQMASKQEWEEIIKHASAQIDSVLAREGLPASSGFVLAGEFEKIRDEALDKRRLLLASAALKKGAFEVNPAGDKYEEVVVDLGVEDEHSIELIVPVVTDKASEVAREAIFNAHCTKCKRGLSYDKNKEVVLLHRKRCVAAKALTV